MYKIIASKYVKAGECIQVDNELFVSMEDYKELKDEDGDISKLLAKIKIVQELRSFEPFNTDVFKASLNA